MWFVRYVSSLSSCCLMLGSMMQVQCQCVAGERWEIDTHDEWVASVESDESLLLENGQASPKNKEAILRSRVRRFGQLTQAVDLKIVQSTLWQDWRPIKNVGPINLLDAPVALVKGPNDYWMFGRYGRKRPGRSKQESGERQVFVSQEVTLEGFDFPLRTTPFPNQYDAPGGLMPALGGYHAWQSRDMVTWIHHGPVTESFSKWVTSAEQIDGETLIYYDFPNDQDSHVYVDSDLFDGKPGVNRGKAVEDPSHGSDAGFIRDLDGRVHVVFEDWSPINASRRSWDSPLAGHAVSSNGIDGFKIVKPAVDRRTQPTGETLTYNHPHWLKEDPEHYSTNVAEYQVHQPEQEAFGDWAPICVGGQYYLFGDYDPVGGHQMSVGWFTASSMDQPFEWCDQIGNGHPDPDICFAEGRFYLVTQQATDYVSDGPWCEKVEARFGVDTDNDGLIDRWTDWKKLQESYEYIKGFSKQIAKTPAVIDLSAVPKGYGFQFEVRLTDLDESRAKPILDKIEVTFE